jgi:hypothetical protein
MSELKLFVPLTKIDEEKRLVYGIATAEQPDRSGEVCDYATTKPFYEKWSSTINKASDGKSLGNLRAMHGKVAAGKIQDILFDDENKRIEICAKVVDDNEWKKVLEGVYTGFSQGGAYVKRWNDENDPAVKRYTANPTEVSLVDLPCLPSATFQMVKADGMVEERHFVKYSEDQSRDERGRWSAGDAAAHGAKAALALAGAAAVHYSAPLLRTLASKALTTVGGALVNSSGGIHMAIVKTAVGLAFTHFVTKGLQEAILAGAGDKIDPEVANNVSVALQAAHTAAGLLKGAASDEAKNIIDTYGPSAIDKFTKELIAQVNAATDISDEVKAATIEEINSRAVAAKKTITLSKSFDIIDGVLEKVSKSLAKVAGDEDSNWLNYVEYASDGIQYELKKYSDDQPRGDDGRWIGGAAGAIFGGGTGALIGGPAGAVAGAIAGGVSGYKQGGIDASGNINILRATVAGVASGVGGGLAVGLLRSGATAAANTIFAPNAPISESAHRASQIAAGINPSDVKAQWSKAAEVAGATYKLRAAELAAGRASRARIKFTAKSTDVDDLLKLISASVADQDMLAKEISTMTTKTPTNDEIAAHAVVLAKAAGKDDNWVDFIDQASAELNKVSETTTTDPVVEPPVVEKTEVVENPTSDDDTHQMWLAKIDGKAFKKKADAIAHNQALKKGTVKIDSPTLASLAKMEEKLGLAKTGDEEVTTENQPSVMKYVKALLGDDLTKYAGEEVWDAGRAMSALSTCFDLLVKEIGEGEDNPGQVASLQKAISALKEFIVSEIQEDNTEVGKFLADIEGAFSKLEKSDKTKDDLVATLCDHLGLQKAVVGEDFQKITADRDNLQKVLDGINPRLEAIQKKMDDQAAELEALKKTANPPPMLRVVEKGHEGGGVGRTIDTPDQAVLKAFDALDPEKKAEILIKVAQQQPRQIA